ncbi:MAG: ABC1 kinase family protein [Opitutales bacterium]
MKALHFLNTTRRAPEIVAALVKWGFEDILLELDAPKFLLKGLTRRDGRDLNTWQRFRLVLEELGPTFVKFGQILAGFPDRLPVELVDELRKLRDAVDPVPWESMKPAIERDLGDSIDNVFAEFDTEPVAAGSLGQVYRGRLRASGQWVAVKAQRLEIERNMLSDFEIIAWFARQLHQRLDELKPMNLPNVVRTVRTSIMLELDYRVEARNADIFAENNPEPEKVYAPRVYNAFTRRTLLVTEWVAGRGVARAVESGFLTLDEAHELAEVGGRSVFHQIIVSGFFHGDPHAGNVFVTDDKRLCFMDWGQAAFVTSDMQFSLADLFEAIVKRDAEKVVHVARDINASSRPIHDTELEIACRSILLRGAIMPNGQTDFGRLGLRLIRQFTLKGVSVPPSYVLVLKAIMSVQEVGLLLNPDFDTQAVGRPFLDRMMWENWKPGNFAKRNIRPVTEAARTLLTIPGEAQRILRRIENEDIRLNLLFGGTDEIQRTLTASINRLVLGIVLAGIIIASSIVLTTGAPPLLWGYPVFGMIGLILSVILGIWLIITILRRGPR